MSVRTLAKCRFISARNSPIRAINSATVSTFASTALRRSSTVGIEIRRSSEHEETKWTMDTKGMKCGLVRFAIFESFLFVYYRDVDQPFTDVPDRWYEGRPVRDHRHAWRARDGGGLSCP